VIDKPRILGLTLARGGSKSVPAKNIQPILGHPLMAYTIAEALQSRWLSRYLVSTDDVAIQQVAKQYGAEAPFLRPAEFATDSASSVSAMQHAVAWAEANDNQQYDYVVELMCTNPLKTVEDIDGCVEKLMETQADSVIAVHRLEDHHPRRIKKIVDDKIVDFCLSETAETRRQDLTPPAYIRSGSIYALKRDYLMVDGRRYGSEDSRPYILPPERAVNVDSAIDFITATALMQTVSRPYVQVVNV
jgi:CMP-N,N'-diacetyllegionaminic acid synthase